MKKSIGVGMALGLLSTIIYYTQMYIQFSISQNEFMITLLLGVDFGLLLAVIFVFSSVSGHSKTFLFWIISGFLLVLLCEVAGMTPNRIYYAMYGYYLSGGGGFALLFTTACFFFSYFVTLVISCLILFPIRKKT